MFPDVVRAARVVTLVLKADPPMPVPAFRATAWAVTAVPLLESMMFPPAWTWSVFVLFSVRPPTKSTFPP